MKLTVTICMKGQAVDRTEHLNALARFTNEKTVSFATLVNANILLSLTHSPVCFLCPKHTNWMETGEPCGAKVQTDS